MVPVVVVSGEALVAGGAAEAVVVGVGLLVFHHVGTPAEGLLAEQALVGFYTLAAETHTREHHSAVRRKLNEGFLKRRVYICMCFREVVFYMSDGECFCSPEWDSMCAFSLSGLLNSLVHPTCVLK